MVVISWRIVELERETLDGYVFRVHYRVDCDDNGIGETTLGTIDLPRPDGELIPFDQLTPQQVVEWVQNSLGSDVVNTIYVTLQNAVVAKANPVTATGLPWSENIPVIVE